jgi:diketogulonate reductase-like aldo/keto reductase
LKHLELLQSTNPKITPCVNQLELHPFLQQKPTVEYCQKHNIAIEAYSPLTRGIYFSDSTVKSIAEAHGVSPAQVLIRWSLQKGYIPLPKSVKKERIASNADVYGFQLSKEEMSRLDSLDKGQAGLTGSWLHDDNDPTSIFDPLDCE